jgi:AMMECR1 domain-containing protein
MCLKYQLLPVLLLLCLPAGAQEDASFEHWRHLDTRTQSEILVLARRAFDAFIKEHRVIDPPSPLPAPLDQRCGVFVSSMRNGAPRCCMGTLYPLQPNTALEIIENAVAAAGRDRRFAPIKPKEAAGLILIVSFVGKPTPISQAELAGLDPTRDGLVVKSGDRYGVVLSGETSTVERMLAWGRVRANARNGASVELFRLPVVRYVEKAPAH